MAVRRLHPEQPHGFAFSAENLAWAKETIAKYPPGKEASAVIPLLWRAQEQCGGWLPEPALRVVADMLGMAHIRAYEIATFYTMFQLSPGRHEGARPGVRHDAVHAARLRRPYTMSASGASPSILTSCRVTAPSPGRRSNAWAFAPTRR